MFTPSVFGDVSLVSVSALAVASAGASLGGMAHQQHSAAGASAADAEMGDSAESDAAAPATAAAGGGRVEEFTAAQHARRGVRLADAVPAGATLVAAAMVVEEVVEEAPPTELEIRWGWPHWVWLQLPACSKAALPNPVCLLLPLFPPSVQPNLLG